jgi:protein gp37
MTKTNIEWTDETWNPITGCDRVSDGCTNCYALSLAKRLKAMGAEAYQRDGDPRTSGEGFGLTLQPDRLDQPLRWTKPRKVFVNSMSDLFHKDVPDTYIAAVFDVMARAPRHTFQLLTKRHARMRSLLTSWATEGMVSDNGWLHKGAPMGSIRHTSPLWTPPPNVILGVSVENQHWANLRIPALLNTPAAARFLSMEPLLGPVDLTMLTGKGMAWNALDRESPAHPPIDWVIVGGESGHGARPMHPDWARTIRDDCARWEVPFLFKQWGEWAPHRLDGGVHVNSRMSKNREQYQSVRFAPDGTPYKASEPDLYSYPGMTSMLRVGKRNAGRVLDGITHDEYPEVKTA